MCFIRSPAIRCINIPNVEITERKLWDSVMETIQVQSYELLFVRLGSTVFPLQLGVSLTENPFGKPLTY